MKKFELQGSAYVKNGNTSSLSMVVRAKSYQELILLIENNHGWYIASNAAFKVAYIEEVK